MIAMGRLGWRRLHHKNGLRLILIERSFTFSAKIIDSPKLDQMAMVASYNFPRIYRGKCCGHLEFGSARAGYSKKNFTNSTRTGGSFKHYLGIVNEKIQAKA